MLHDHQKLVSVFALAGEIIGRKKLQKMVFIAKKMNFPFQEKFEFHFYGPYSEELTLRVEELCDFGFVEEVKEDKGGYSQYRYMITSSGYEFLESESMDIPQLKECLVHMNQQSSRFLELVSTILYFDELPKADVIDKVADLKRKQNYSLQEIDEAYEYINTLQKTAFSH